MKGKNLSQLLFNELPVLVPGYYQEPDIEEDHGQDDPAEDQAGLPDGPDQGLSLQVSSVSLQVVQVVLILQKVSLLQQVLVLLAVLLELLQFLHPLIQSLHNFQPPVTDSHCYC